MMDKIPNTTATLKKPLATTSPDLLNTNWGTREMAPIPTMVQPMERALESFVLSTGSLVTTDAMEPKGMEVPV